MMNSIFVNKSQFKSYLGCSENTAYTKYDLYLKLAGKDKKQQLTIFDLSRLDDVPLDSVKNILFPKNIKKH